MEMSHQGNKAVVEVQFLSLLKQRAASRNCLQSLQPGSGRRKMMEKQLFLWLYAVRSFLLLWVAVYHSDHCVVTHRQISLAILSNSAITGDKTYGL